MERERDNWKETMAKPISVEALYNHSVNMITQLISIHAANPAKIKIIIWVSLLSKRLLL